MVASALVLKVKGFINKNQTETILLVLILLVASFLRLYHIDQYMTFLGDEGRDVIIVRRLLVNFDPILIGPGTSIGNMYLGPLYYYLMAIPLLVANFSPVGPAVFVALLGVATVFFIWYVCRNWFSSKYIALAFALLYAISPTAIIFSRSSWNPNIMPFFALLTIWSVWKTWKEKSYKWFIGLGISFAFVLNSHYIGLLLLPVILIPWILSYKEAKRERKTKTFLRSSLWGILIFALLMSPLLLFDLRHNFQNFRAMQIFIANRETAFKGLSTALSFVGYVFVNLFTRLPGGLQVDAGIYLAIFSLVAGGVYFVIKRTKEFGVIVLWIVIGVVGMAFVQKEIYDHYLGFLYPAPYLILAGIFSYLLVSKKLLARYVLILALIYLVVMNLNNLPIKYPGNSQMARSKEVAQKIIDESGGTKLNLAVLAEQNYEDGYKYFVEVAGVEVLHADVWNKSTSISDQLFVVCERPKEECKPTTNPKAEVANFGMTEIENEWEVGGVLLYKLRHKVLQ